MALLASIVRSRFHQRSHCFRVWKAACLQTPNYADLIFRWLVLADFPFTEQLGYNHFYTNYGRRDSFDMFRRRVGDRPRFRNGRFIVLGKSVELCAQPRRIIYDAQNTISMHDSIVPGGHHFTGFFLCGVPRGGDVRVWALEDG